MLKDNNQMTMNLSPYQGLYEVIIPQDYLLRRLKEKIDFSFVNPMLCKQYCENFGRPAKEPEMMFKLLFLKKLYDLSDERLISSAQTDMAYKYFLNLSPEDKMINASLLTKFRKARITEDILDDMLKETIQQAIQKGPVKSGTIIVDATHTEAAARAKSVTQVLRDLTRTLRKEIYRHEYDLSEKFLEKPSVEAYLSEEIAYTYELLEKIRDSVKTIDHSEIKKLYSGCYGFICHAITSIFYGNCGKYEKNRIGNFGLTARKPFPFRSVPDNSFLIENASLFSCVELAFFSVLILQGFS